MLIYKNFLSDTSAPSLLLQVKSGIISSQFLFIPCPRILKKSYLLSVEESESFKAITYKTSFPPISNSEIEILILGTLPGDRSLQIGEYFAHPRNRFWKIISEITDNPLPGTYSDKLDLLHKSRIGVWNVLHKASRKGSLDSAIKDGVPNDIPNFIASHKNLKVIAFDGLKPEALYDKYFTRSSSLSYISLPACSPANARYNLSNLCDKWKEILSY